MKRKSLLFLMLMALFAPLAMNAQLTLTVKDDATGSNSYVPIYGLYVDDYQRSQTIYPSSLLTSMQGGTITKLTYYKNSTNPWTDAVFQVTLGTTTTSAFSNSSSSSYLTLSNSVVVYSGKLENTGQTMEIVFSTPFTYSSGNLVVDIQETTTGTYSSASFIGEAASTYYSCSSYNGNAVPTSGTPRQFMPKTTFTYLSTTPYISLAPTAATVLTGSTQTLTATYGNVSGTPTITYSSSNTSVATVSGSGTTATVTAVAPGTATITATMNGSYTATCAITVEDPSYCTPSFGSNDDCITNITLGSINNTTAGSSTNGYGDYTSMSTSLEQGETATMSLTSGAGSGTHAAAVWIDFDNSYSFESSERVGTQGSISGSTTVSINLTIPADAPVGSHRMRVVYQYYVNATSIDPCASATYGEGEDYTVVVAAASTCPKPTPGNVTNLMPTSATLNWTGEADEYYVRYRTAAYEEVTFFEDFEDPNQLTGWTPIDNDGDGYGWQLANMTTHSGDYAIASASYINNVGSLTPDNWLITPQLDLQGTMKVWLSGFDNTYYNEHFAIYLSTTGNSISDFTTTLVAETTTINQYVEKTADLSGYAGQKGYIAIRHFNCTNEYWINVDDFGIYVSHDAGQWIPNATGANTSDNSHDITGLTPETDYEWQVMADCGTDGESGWSAMTTFTTPSACAAPFDPNTTDITANSAKLNWTGYQDEYNVSYGKVLFYEDFEDGDLAQAGWTVYTLGESPNTNGWYAYDASSNWTNHNGNYSASAWSWTGSAYDANNWLVSPQVTLDGTLSFWVYGNYEDEYEVLLSTNGYTTSDFNVTLQAMTAAPKSWTEINIDLSSYNGAQGYIAIHHVFNDGNVLLVDDFGIYELESTTSTANNVTVYDLTSETDYIWKVQGADCDGNGGTTDWSEYVFFTTTNVGYVLHIDGYNDSSDGWYLIASPIGDVPIGNVTNLNANQFDLYYFDQTQQPYEWINYYQGSDSNFNSLQKGKGYLYANSGDVDLVFNGTAYNQSGDVTLVYSDENSDSNMWGWNLVGNPFPVEATVGDWDYMRMSADHNEIILYDPLDPVNIAVAPMEGIFVHATADGGDEQKVTFTPSSAKSATNGEAIVVNISQDQKVMDRAIVRFGEGRELPKCQLNENSTKIYFPVDGEDFAVVRSEGIGELPVSFKAEENGNYTLSLNAEGVSFGYLHLIDNMTGNDVDMLVNPSYSFESRTSDYSHRFKLVFATGDNANDNFAYFSNGSFVINNEGKAMLQVIDITGRILKSESINGCANLNFNAAPGVYMIRLVNGTDVKVQKVVVK